MEKITTTDPLSYSADLIAENTERLCELFPQIVTEDIGLDGKVSRRIDFAVLKELLGGELATSEEKYGLNWYGKRAARRLALTPSLGTLRPAPEESVDWDTTQNLMIEGDNLEVLKLLQKSYASKVKMIYIDPPYNTGSDFVYADDFSDSIGNYLRQTGQIDAEGARQRTDIEAGGRFHTDWLTMMYPRLCLARNLLADDGVLFASIDDGESENLRSLCDTVFGSENYINTVSVNMKNVAGASGGGEDKRLRKNIEYVHIYAKSYQSFSSFNNAYEYTPIETLLEQYRNDGVSWKYNSVLTHEGEKHFVGSTVDGDGNEIRIYKRILPVLKTVNQIMREEGIPEAEVLRLYAQRVFQTQMPQSSIRPRVMKKFEELGLHNELCSIEYVPRSGKNKGKIYEQFYKGEQFRLLAWLGDVTEEREGKLNKKDLQGTYWNFVSETKNLTKEGETPLPNGKKPLALLRRILQLDGSEDPLILDFFAGSGTTAHAMWMENLKDGGKRRFILVQIPEFLNPNNDDHKAAIDFCDAMSKPRSVAELTKERLRRAGKRICSENPMFSGDIGFRVLKLDTTSVHPWDPTLPVDPQRLLGEVDNILPGRTEHDLLCELLLKRGLELTTPIVELTLAGKQVFAVSTGDLITCLDPHITEADVEELANGIIKFHKELAPPPTENPETPKAKPAKFEPPLVVFRDTAFVDDVTKSNLTEILKQHGLTDVRSL